MAGACADRGPWPCEEDNCPAPTLGCGDLATLGVCASRFEEVWESQVPAGMTGRRVSDECPRSCGKCSDKEEL